jgi:hypothetical protein
MQPKQRLSLPQGPERQQRMLSGLFASWSDMAVCDACTNPSL